MCDNEKVSDKGEFHEYLIFIFNPAGQLSCQFSVSDTLLGSSSSSSEEVVSSESSH